MHFEILVEDQYAELGSVWPTRCTKADQKHFPPKVGRRLVPKSRSGLKKSRRIWMQQTMHPPVLSISGESCLNLLTRRNDVVRRGLDDELPRLKDRVRRKSGL